MRAVVGIMNKAQPNVHEFGHMRAPGVDYFTKYNIFSRVAVYSSNDFDSRYQTYLKIIGRWEERWPPKPSFLQQRSMIKVMPDFVPVYFA